MELPPSDEYGPVRDRRDLKPLQLSLKPILPCPSRDLSFSIRGGCWSYSPSVTFNDRLGSIRESSETPSTTVATSKAFGEVNLSRVQVPGDYDECRARKRLQCLKIGSVEHTKRQRIENGLTEDAAARMEGTSSICDAVATVVSESTSSSSSTGKSEMADVAGGNVVPKAALYSFYGKKKTQVANKQYLTWNDGARTHELRWTAIFVCPLSFEPFLAGRYGSSYEEDGSIIWYNKKSLAEHAAAARAYDCFMLRESKLNSARKTKQLGKDQPYHTGDKKDLPKEIPRFIISALESTRRLRCLQPTNTNTGLSHCPTKNVEEKARSVK